MKKLLLLLICLSGILLVIAGVVFTPSFVAKYVKHVDALSISAANIILSYRLYAITLGCLAVFVSVLLYGVRYTKIIFLSLFATYILLAYVVYINEKYPQNIILNSSGVVKAWNVLMGRTLVLGDHSPKSALVVDNRRVLKAKYPVIDVHFHFGSMKNLNADELIKAMDECGVAKIVNLDGGPTRLEGFIKEFRDKYPDRFIMFAQLNLPAIGEPDFAEKQVALLEKAVGMGVKGLKVPKTLGLKITEESGRLVAVDDPRFDPIWSKAAELNIPVLMHISDPTPFFQPVDRFNERYEELSDFPEWSYDSPYFPSKETLLKQRENMLKKHPETIFIGAHLGDSPEDLNYVAYLFDKYPNYYVDISARLPEIGRQPYTAREFFIKYQDRILFGSDGGYALGGDGWAPERFYRTYFEFLETENEYFEYPLSDIQKQGRWRIYGINLPDEVLGKIYYKNAAKILGLGEVGLR